ncbi:Clp protease N-terminal domain-containing protein [Kinneretia aquatilis]|uniref:Clp protease N-terminal domain-containing protein n=1 Tax=Kinneretia aquatilis TaxID=2070761 RepID=UPI00149509B0|nr:Clp protease N-terminal domain-containing protein [Paucibacter aquatile]WIV97445.1 Clp protease N-terminal domain-containing protein [Paucibacter aquatile]
MFKAIRNRLADVRQLSRLCSEAEQQARQLGQARPGSEHFTLAALALPDGSALRVFQQLGIDAAAYRAALQSQHAEALAAAGIALDPASAAAAAPQALAGEAGGLYRAEASAQVFMQRLAAARGPMGSRRLHSADVLLAVSQESYSLAARAFQQLGISAQRLATAARAELPQQA